MSFFLIISALLWGIGHLAGAPLRARLAMISLLYGAILLVHLLLSADNALRLSIGGSFGGWLVLGGAVVLSWVYARFLGRLKARSAPVETAPGATFSEAELERYARHIVLREIGGSGQKRLKAARVLVVGAGGLGSPALLYLAAAGVGTIGVVDDDIVDNSNLQRQVIHRDADIGKAKVFSAEAAMRAQNPHVTVRPYNRCLNEAVAAALIADYDLVLDGTDNFDTRYLINRVCAAAAKPLVAAALTQLEGQISIYDPASGAPCYQCIFPKAPAPGLAPACAEAGVLGPLPGVVGAMMAVEAVKLISQAGTPLRGTMLIYDALYGESRRIGLKSRSDCPICGNIARERALLRAGKPSD
ncbi:MAG: ThiF family adenylyltransferase [Halocynthiibacter sp.]